MSENEQLREIIKRIVNHEWIIATAYNDPTRDFGYQVNVRDEPSKGKEGTQTYSCWRETFAFTAIDAGLRGLELEASRV